MPRNGKYQTEFWREYSQKHVDDSRKEQVKYISVIFMVKNKCKKNGNKWRKGKADHIKKHMREAKRGNGPSKNRGSDFRKDDKYRAKNGSGKKRFILRSRRLFLPTTKANSSMANIFIIDRAT